MSNLRVNKITNYADDGPVEFSSGLTVPSGKTLDGTININSTGIVTSTSLVVSQGLNLSGVATAASYVGSGIGLTGVPGTPNGKGIAFVLIS
jgi:hypothetical protein|tara:strand:- start:1060 stop:1335 length:276 start_codon:yes stop_codon:yes gene_type:complete